MIMICSKRVFRLSAYTLMANVALADSVMMMVAGVYCGTQIIWPEDPEIQLVRLPRSYVFSGDNLVVGSQISSLQ